MRPRDVCPAGNTYTDPTWAREVYRWFAAATTTQITQAQITQAWAMPNAYGGARGGYTGSNDLNLTSGGLWQHYPFQGGAFVTGTASVQVDPVYIGQVQPGSSWLTYSWPSFTLDEVIATEEFERHPDPDVLLGEAYRRLERRARARIEEDYVANEDTAGIWREWVIDAEDLRYDDTAQYIGARVTPRSQDPTADVWAGWARGTEPLTGPVSVIPPRMTAAQVRRDREATLRQRQIYARNTRVIGLRHRVAARRAGRLLRSLLDEQQRADLERANHFEVIGSDGARYQVAKGYVGNVYLLDANGHRVTRFCGHCAEFGMPDEDHMIGQKLMLEADALGYRRMANASSLW